MNDGKANALSYDMIAALRSAIERAESEARVAVMMLRTAPREPARRARFLNFHGTCGGFRRISQTSSQERPAKLINLFGLCAFASGVRNGDETRKK